MSAGLPDSEPPDPKLPDPKLPDPKEVEELLLGGELRYTRVDAVRLSGVTRDFSSRLWRAFGYPSMPDEAVAYTEGDVADVGGGPSYVHRSAFSRSDDTVRSAPSSATYRGRRDPRRGDRYGKVRVKETYRAPLGHRT